MSTAHMINSVITSEVIHDLECVQLTLVIMYSLIVLFVLTAILDDSQSVTFMSLKPRMTELLLRFLHAETDATNIQMLLGKCQFVLYLRLVFPHRIVCAKMC